MPEIIITVRDKLPVIVGDVKAIVTKNSDYTVRFMFDEQWEDGEKNVYFIRSNGYVFPPVKTANDVVSVPVQHDAGLMTRLLIGVQQGNIKTSRPCALAVYPSVTDMIEDDAVQPDESLWEDVMKRIEKLEKNGVSETQIALLIETDMLPAVHDTKGRILTDENGNVILRY